MPGHDGNDGWPPAATDPTMLDADEFMSILDEVPNAEGVALTQERDAVATGGLNDVMANLGLGPEGDGAELLETLAADGAMLAGAAARGELPRGWVAPAESGKTFCCGDSGCTRNCFARLLAWDTSLIETLTAASRRHSSRVHPRKDDLRQVPARGGGKRKRPRGLVGHVRRPAGGVRRRPAPCRPRRTAPPTGAPSRGASAR